MPTQATTDPAEIALLIGRIRQHLGEALTLVDQIDADSVVGARIQHVIDDLDQLSGAAGDLKQS